MIQVSLLSFWGLRTGLRTKSWTKTDHRRKDQAARPRQRLKSNGLRQPRDCLMRFRLYQCR